MAFTDEQIRALVRTGQYSDPRAEDWITQCLIQRRDKIGRAFFPKVLPLDQFEVRDGRLAFEDLAVKHQLVTSREYTAEWSRFNNETEEKTPLSGATGLELPRELLDAETGAYFMVTIRGGDKEKTVSVYLLQEPQGFKVVGVERKW